MRIAWVVGHWTALVVVSGCGGAVSNGAELEAALSGAAPGEVVEVAEGTFEGAFVVPAGVRVVGAGRGRTRIVATMGRPALRLVPGATATSVSDVTVVAEGGWGVVARDAGVVVLERLEIEVPSHGVAAGFQGLTSLRMTETTLRGPVTRETADAVPSDPGPDESAPFGLVLVGIDAAEIDGVEASGFASVAILAVGSGTVARDVTIHDNLGTGLMVFGGTADLTDVSVSDTYEGTRLLPAYNAIFAGGAIVDTHGLESRQSEGYGVVIAGASGDHTDLVSSGNAATGLWIQGASDVSVTGATLEDNAQAGVVLVDSQRISLTRVAVRRTRMGTRLGADGVSVIDMGDGVQIVDAMQDLGLAELDLVDNERVGLLLAMDSDDLSTTTMTAIHVEGSGDMLGCVAQGPSVSAGWDDGVERTGAVVVNDAALAVPLDVVSIVAPTDFPLGLDLGMLGIDAIVAPTD